MLKKVGRVLQDIVFPPYCPGCGRLLNFGKDWCEECLQEVCSFEKIEISNFEYIDEAYSLGKYEGGLRQVIYDIKFNNRKGISIKLEPFLELLINRDELDAIDLVIPIPISSKKRKKRKYNQVDIIFKKWIIEQGYSWEDILLKENDTKPMFSLNKEERIKNITGAFHFLSEKDQASVKDKNILLVDDIFTTESTMEVVSKLLKQNGAKKITALTLASGAV